MKPLESTVKVSPAGFTQVPNLKVPGKFSGPEADKEGAGADSDRAADGDRTTDGDSPAAEAGIKARTSVRTEVLMIVIFCG